MRMQSQWNLCETEDNVNGIPNDLKNSSRWSLSCRQNPHHRQQQQPRRRDNERVNVIVHVERVEGRSPVATLSNDMC